MAANTTLLIAVAAMAVLLLAGILGVVVHKTRKRTVRLSRDQTEKNALRHSASKALADEYAAKEHPDLFEFDVKRPGLAAYSSKRQSIAAKQPPPATN